MSVVYIPDLDDGDEVDLPFVGRGFGQQGSFGAHGRENSNASDPATGFQFPNGRTASAGNAPRPNQQSVSSITSYGTGFDSAANASSTSLSSTGAGTSSGSGFSFPVRKTSFANLKNAFKGASHHAPPVPTVDPSYHSGLPALRNPFTRAESPIATQKIRSAARPHGRKQSSHSHRSGASSGSNRGRNDETVPALPPIPRKMGGRRNYSVSNMSEGSAQGNPPEATEPNTPSEYALQVLFRRFVKMADTKVATLMAKPLTMYPSIVALFAAGVDPAFDSVISSLAQVAKRNARQVTEAVMSWVRTQTEGVSRVEVRNHMTGAIGPSHMKIEDAASILAERKLLSARYILSRVLIEIITSIPRDALDEDLGNSLEQNVFNAYRADHPDQLAQFFNRRANSELYADFLGKLSSFRLLSVSDRFISELNKLAKQTHPPKDIDARVEHIIRGMAHLQVRVFPEDDLDVSADFLHDVARWFANAHGTGVKLAYAEMLNKILHPIVQSATAEVNHPVWSKAVAIVYQRAVAMSSKPRYWSSSFPLVITSLCVSPREVFMDQWMGHVDTIIIRLKDRASRAIAINSLLRLLWLYLNRCVESSTSTAKRLDVLLRIIFPPGASLYPTEIPLSPFIAVLHYVMVKQLDYGKGVTLDFLRESVLGRDVNLASKTDQLTPERMTVALRALVTTLSTLDGDQGSAWPANPDYAAFEPLPVVVGDALPDGGLDKPGMADLIKRCAPTIVNILYLCDRDIGHLLLFDERYSSTRTAYSSTDATPDRATCKHGDVFVTFPRRYRPRIDLLTAAIDALPRCHVGETRRVIEILCRTSFHVDPTAAMAAAKALKRFAANPAHCLQVVESFRHFLFESNHVFREGAIGARLYSMQLERVLRLWVELLDQLASHNRAAQLNLFAEDQSFIPVTTAVADGVEAGGLFALLSTSVAIRKLAVEIMRIAAALAEPPQRRTSIGARLSRFVPAAGPERTVQCLAWQAEDATSVRQSTALNAGDRARLETWTKSGQDDWLLSIAQSEHSKDSALWMILLPFALHRIADEVPHIMEETRTIVVSTVLRIHGAVSLSSGVTQSRRGPAGPTAESVGLAEQWRSYVTFLCASTTPDIIAVQSPARGEVLPTAERLGTPRGLFTLILPFLTSDQSRFRDAVVYPLGCVRQPLLRPLLEQLQAITRHLYDDFRGRSKTRRNNEQSRLHTAVAQVFRLVSPLLADQRSLVDTVILTSMINFVRETYLFLADPEVREDFALQRLRRYFCGVVEQLCNALSRLDQANRFFPTETRGAIYKMASEWCTLGRRADVAKARESATLLAAADSYQGERDKAQYLDMLQADTRLLSHAAADCMAALCQGPLLSDSAATPEQHASTSVVEPLAVLAWVRGLLSSSLPALHDIARKALLALIKYNRSCSRLLDEILHQSYAEGEQFSIRRSFFGVVVTAVTDGSFPLEPSEVACLGLSKLGHPLSCVRERAFDLIETLLPAAQDRLLLAPLHPAIGSSAAVVNVSAQRQISEHLALAYADQAAAFVNECARRVSQLDAPRRSATLAVLPPWLATLDLMPSEQSEATLTSLVYMAVRFTESLPLEMQALWRSLTCGAFPGNATALVKYLLEQGTRRRSVEFVVHARRIIGSLAESNIGPAIFEEVCSLIEPAAMVPLQETAGVPSALDPLFDSQAKPVSLSTGQLAILFAGDVLLERAADAALGPRVAVLLHAVITQVDHPVAVLREAAQAILLQALRSWICDVALDEDTALRWLETRRLIAELANQSGAYWAVDDYGTSDGAFRAPKSMIAVVDKILVILTPYHPTLRQEWGELALEWGTSCPIRHLACRSFQLFRILMPRISPPMLADMLGRLSNTVSDVSREIQAFSREIIHTLSSIVQVTSADDLLAVPQVFWGTVSCLSTTVEEEYADVVDLLANLLDKVDLGDPTVAKKLASQQPADWASPDLRLQSLLLRGLRSSKTDEASFDVIRRLAGIADDLLVDSHGDRLVNGLVASLPWLLRSLDEGAPSEEMALLAMDLARMADECEKASVSRLLLSFAKHRFRTKDDFIRQLAAALRDALVTHAKQVVTALVGLVLNAHDWIRDKTLQVLKLVLQAPEARGILADGTELLMPLLRLLHTGQAAYALEVLDVPIAAALTPGHRRGSLVDVQLEGSGWNADTEDAPLTRRNVLAVYNTFTVDTRAASTHFSTVLRFADVMDTEGDNNASQVDLPSYDASMGDLVGALHTLNQFFDDGDEEARPTVYHGVTESASEDKVRAIMSRALGQRRHVAQGSDAFAASDNEGSVTEQFHFPQAHQSQTSMSSLGIGSDSDFGERRPESAFGLDEDGSDETDGGMPALPVGTPVNGRFVKLLAGSNVPSTSVQQ